MQAAIATPFPASRADEPAPATDLDCEFRLLTDRGHRALRDGDAGRAESCFRGALEEAERIFQVAEGGGSVAPLLAPMLLTVGRRNLAEARACSGDPSGAREHLESAVERLIGTAAHPGRPPILRIACVRHLRHALGFLAQCDHGPDASRFDRLAERTRTVAAEVVRAATLIRRPAAQPSAGRLS